MDTMLIPMKEVTDLTDDQRYIEYVGGVTFPRYQPTSTLPPTNGTGVANVVFPTIYMSIAVIGGLTNLFIIIAVTSHRLLWTPTYFYILNVAISDFFICVVCCPFNAYASLYEQAPDGCAVVGVLVNVFMIASLISLSAVALNRYMLVKMSNEKYKSHFVCHRILISVGVIWCFSLLCLVPMAFNQAKPGYDTHYGACLSASNKSSVVFDSLQAGLFGFPSICLIYYCYAQIWRVFRSSVQSLDSMGPQKRSTKSFKLTRNLFVVTTIYTICWIPSFILMIFDQDLRAPRLLHQSAAALAVSHSMINPITYLVLNRSLYSAYYSMFLCCRRNSDLHCCGCMFYCLRGQAIPSPTSTGGTNRGRANTLRKISNQIQLVLGRDRSTTMHSRSSTMRDRSMTLRKISDPTPSNRLAVPTVVPTRRVSEPPPQRKLSIVSEAHLSPASSVKTRRVGTCESTHITALFQQTPSEAPQAVPEQPVITIEQSGTVSAQNVAEHSGQYLHKPGVICDLSTSDSGCEMIPLTTFQTKAEVNELHYGTGGPTCLDTTRALSTHHET